MPHWGEPVSRRQLVLPLVLLLLLWLLVAWQSVSQSERHCVKCLERLAPCELRRQPLKVR